MAKGKSKDDDDEIIPSPEQAKAYGEYAQAVVALARFDRYCAGLSSSHMNSHPVERDCFTLPTLGQVCVLVEYSGVVGLGVPPVHANWLEGFPIDFVAVTRNELFLVTKGFSWLGADVPSIGVSLGGLLTSKLLAKMCSQKTMGFFCVDGPLIGAAGGLALRADRPAMVFHTVSGVELLKTRQHYEKLAHDGRTDLQSVLENHFLG